MTHDTKTIGYWDKAGRYYINVEYMAPSARAIRAPSRHWPRSLWAHVHTTKYAKELAALLGVASVTIL